MNSPDDAQELLREIAELQSEREEWELHASFPPESRDGNGKRQCAGHTPETDSQWKASIDARTNEAFERAACVLRGLIGLRNEKD